MFANNEKYPRIGVYVVFETSDSRVLVKRTKMEYSLPFVLFKGGETWEELVVQQKKSLQISEASHKWIGSGVAPSDHPYPLVYCVFKVKIDRSQAFSLKPFWAYLENELPIDPISSRILNQFRFSSISSFKD